MKRVLLSMAVIALASAPAVFATADTLELHAPFVLNGVEIPPGEYRIAVSPSLYSVQFVRGRLPVVTAPCKVSLADPSVARDEVHSRPDAAGREKITRLVLSRSRMSVEILDAASVASGPAASATEAH